MKLIRVNLYVNILLKKSKRLKTNCLQKDLSETIIQLKKD